MFMVIIVLLLKILHIGLQSCNIFVFFAQEETTVANSMWHYSANKCMHALHVDVEKEYRTFTILHRFRLTWDAFQLVKYIHINQCINLDV